MATRERILALEPRGKGVLAYTIRSDAEVRKPEEIFDEIADIKPDSQMVAIAEKIIEQQEEAFDPSVFVDRYEEALKGLIADKQKGRKVSAVAEPEDTNVVDLMSALRASLSGDRGGGKRASRSSARAPAKRKTTKPKARKAG
jgi:DNA end-binding protein Ku